jgi:hypothetical protein
MNIKIYKVNEYNNLYEFSGVIIFGSTEKSFIIDLEKETLNIKSYRIMSNIQNITYQDMIYESCVSVITNNLMHFYKINHNK